MRLSIRSTIVPAVAALLLAGCASASTQRAYVAPTHETITSTTEEREGNPPAHLIYIQNRSTVPVTVFSVTLSGCENVKQQCTPHPANLRVRPGERQLAIRVEPRDAAQAFGYHFGFSWHADSASTQALNALAANGDASARARVDAMRHADSLEHAERGPRYNELSRTDFVTLASRARTLRAVPDSLVLAPGQRASVEQVRLLVLDSAGAVLGQTRWLRYQIPSSGAVAFVPPTTLIARSAGRAVLRFRLADEAQTMLANVPNDDVEVPVVVAYATDPHAPTFEGIAVDAASKAPLGCLRVALEDSARNTVASGRTDREGTFILAAPRPGSYAVRFETFGWAPVGSPLQSAQPDEIKQQQYVVSFTERLLSAPMVTDFSGTQHPYPVAVTASAFAKPPAAGTTLGKATRPVVKPAPRMIVQSVSLRGSETMPILNVVGNAPPGTIWIQFVVDSAGQVDPKTIIYPANTDDRAIGSVNLVLPHVRFSPARENDRAACELMRMQVNFTPR